MTTFCRLDWLRLEVTGQYVRLDRAILACRVVDPDDWCQRCGRQSVRRDTVTRQLGHEPFGWCPTTLLISVRRYRCMGCGHVWRQDTTKASEPRAKLSRRGLRWALEGIVCQHLTVARIVEGLGVTWNTASKAVLAEGKRVLIDDPDRFDGVKVIGVDEHVWRHTRRGDKYVTVIITLTPIRDGTGPSRLLDLVEGRSKQVFARWLQARPQAWRDGVEVVAMDGFSGFKSAASEELPDAVPVMDPFHVIRLAGAALDSCRRRVQQQTHGHRSRAKDPLYKARRTLHTGADPLTDKQRQRLEDVFATDTHAEAEATWGIYQRMITAYREPDRALGKKLMQTVIDSLKASVPVALTELKTLGPTLNRRAKDVLAYFDKPGTSNGPSETINGRLEHLRGSALASGTSPTMSPDPYWNPAASDRNYTLNSEEPRFYQELGARMNIAGFAPTFQEAERFFDGYEREKIAYSPASAQLMASTVQVLKSRLPAPASPLTKPILSAMFDDDRLTDALGLPRATRLSKTVLKTALNTRNTLHRRRPRSTEPHFKPGEEGSNIYPNGYRLDDIGPESIMNPASQPNHEHS